jgi:hypothetical protein
MAADNSSKVVTVTVEVVVAEVLAVVLLHCRAHVLCREAVLLLFVLGAG